MNLGIRERVVQFGPKQSLVGILTTGRAASSELPHVVIVNAGIVHRVGPNRLYVDMARSIAALGYPVLRFDLAGLGDSDAVNGGASLLESAIQDVQQAMDHLQQTRQATQFLVFGLCSGANYAMATAFSDRRVIGVMMIDPSVSRTTRSKLVHAMRRLRHAGTLRELLLFRHPVFRRPLGRSFNPALSVARAADGQSGQRASTESTRSAAADVRPALAQLIDRGAQLMMVFTGGVNHVYNYRDQLFDLLPGFDFRKQLKLEYMPDTDHTVSDAPGRARLLESVRAWLCASFPAEGSGVKSREHVAAAADAVRTGSKA